MLTSISDSDGYIILDPQQCIEENQFCEVYCYDSKRDTIPVMQLNSDDFLSSIQPDEALRYQFDERFTLRQKHSFDHEHGSL